MLALFQAGGPVMYPLLLCSLLTVGVVLERLYFWLRMARRKRSLLDSIVASAGESTHREQRVNLRLAAEREAAALNRYQDLLSTMVSLAPLLGIFGTVLGIMDSFDILGDALADGADAAKEGLARALLTTAFGLLTAMTSLVAHRVFGTRIAALRHDIEAVCTQFELSLDDGTESHGDP